MDAPNPTRPLPSHGLLRTVSIFPSFALAIDFIFVCAAAVVAFHDCIVHRTANTDVTSFVLNPGTIAVVNISRAAGGGGEEVEGQPRPAHVGENGLADGSHRRSQWRRK